MKKLTGLVLAILTLTLGFLVVLPAMSNEAGLADGWQSAPSLPYRVQEIYPTVFNNHIVVAGGLSPDVGSSGIGVSDRVVVFSLEEQSWNEGPTLPEPRHHPMLVVVNDRLFSFGGFTLGENGAWHNSRDVLELIINHTSENSDKLSHGEWVKIAEMPTPLAETLSAVNDNKVHLVSGRTPIDQTRNNQWIDHTDVNYHFIFDPETLIWAEGVSVPTARNSACSVTTQNRLHTIAGRTVAGGNLASHEVYHFADGSWHSLAPLPQAQGGLACAAVNNDIYVFGGEFFDNGGGVYAQIWKYNIATDTWSEMGKAPKPRHGLGALAVGDQIYVIGGALEAGGNQTSNAMTVYSPLDSNYH
ncbi:kelch repeat-containing protein [Alteromonas sp. KUL49]|uniref:Kelch repeat-containing protein n=1 Tax=Alteromonas sp. KUL49 TaxID=2480798 RepID=UPI0010FFB47F|nr:kelch repeat-containing protein [Alteromonas sp. KUL49]GEA13188.1 hypothetical protein KUL49_35630 [Alteromonas sp. KUL49]